MKTWYTISNVASAPAAEIDILDEIGVWGVTVKDFANSLKAVPMDREIVLTINSPGGSVFDGFGIYDLIAARREKVTARVLGLAASMGSIIALAGKRTIASENSTLMIHKPNGGAYGESEDMRKMADLLDKLEGRLVNVYVQKTGKNEVEVKAAMESVTWFTAAEAKDWGLVDEVTAPVRVAASFDLKRFGEIPDKISNGGASASTKNPPQENMKSLLAALVEAKLIASADLNDESAAAQVRAAFAHINSQLSDAVAKLKEQEGKIAAMAKAVESDLRARAEAAVDAAVKSGKIKDEKDLRAKWVDAYVANEDSTKILFDSLAEPKAANRASPPIQKPQAKDESKPVLTGRARVAAHFSDQFKTQN